MLSLTTTQQTIIDSKFKKVDWLFEVEDKNQALYHWSTKDIPEVTVRLSRTKWTGIVDPTANSISWTPYTTWVDQQLSYHYEFNVTDFSGISMYRNKAERGLVAASTLKFSVLNKDSIYNPKDFETGRVKVSLRISDGTNSEVIRVWRFVIKRTEPHYQKFACICEDWLQEKLRGDYPNTKLVRNMFKDANITDDNVCVPIPFGTAYVPIRPVYVNSNVSVTGTDISAVASADGSRCLIKRSGATDFKDFNSLRYVTVSGFTESANNGTFMVLCATGQQLELSTSAGLATEAEGDSVTITQGQVYYVLGDSDYTYSISKVRSPRAWGRKSEWTGDYNMYPVFAADSWVARFHQSTEWPISIRFLQSTITDDDGDSFRVVQPFIADADNDGKNDSVGIWVSGDRLLDMPTKFTRSAGPGTNPAKVLEWILRDMGVSQISYSHFATAAATFDSWGLAWNGALWYKEDRKKLLSRLLVMCHSNLVAGESAELWPISAISQKTVTGADILKQADIGVGSFTYTDIRTEPSDDCGYMVWQQDDAAQDAFMKTLVPAKGANMTRYSNNICELPWVQDSQDALRLACLSFQRQLMTEATINFSAKATCLALNPADVITISDESVTGHRPYGGGTVLQWSTSNSWATDNQWDTLDYDVVIESMVINKDVSIDFSCTRYSCSLDDFGTLIPGAIAPATDDTSSAWMPALSGPLSDENIVKDSITTFKNCLIVSPNSGQGDASSLAEALAALKDSNANGICLKSGIHVLTGPITFPDRDVDIYGEAGGSVVVKLYDDPAASTYHFKIAPKQGRTYSFTDFKIISPERTYTSGQNNYVFYITGGKSFAFKNVQFELFGKAISPHIAWLPPTVANGDSGIHADFATQCESFTVDQCLIHGGRYGIYLKNILNATVTKNVMEYNFLAAFSCEEVVHSSVQNNVMAYFEKYGLTVYGTNTAITGNYIESLYDEFVEQVNLWGIYAQTSYGVINGNRIKIRHGRANDCDSFALSAASGVFSVQGNNIEMYAQGAAGKTMNQYAIYLNSCNDGSFCGNNIVITGGVITGARDGIALVSSARNTIDNNTFDMGSAMALSGYGIVGGVGCIDNVGEHNSCTNCASPYSVDVDNLINVRDADA